MKPDAQFTILKNKLFYSSSSVKIDEHLKNPTKNSKVVAKCQNGYELIKKCD